MKKSKVGEIQLILGVVLLIATVICIPLVVSTMYLDNLQSGIEGISSIEWDAETDSDFIIGLLINSVILQSLVATTTGAIFILGGVILLFLSIMLILQGLANRSQ